MSSCGPVTGFESNMVMVEGYDFGATEKDVFMRAL